MGEIKMESADSVFKKLSAEILRLRTIANINNKYKKWYQRVEEAFSAYNIPADHRKQFYDTAVDPYDELFAFSLSTGTATTFKKLSCILLKISEWLMKTTAHNNSFDGFNTL